MRGVVIQPEPKSAAGTDLGQALSHELIAVIQFAELQRVRLSVDHHLPRRRVRHTANLTVQIQLVAVSNDGVERICTALEKNQTVTRVDLRHNAITAKGVTRFAKLMTRANPPLEWVNLQSVR